MKPKFYKRARTKGVKWHFGNKMGIVIEEYDFKGSFSSNNLKSMKTAVEISGFKDDIKARANYVYLAKDYDVVIGAGFAVKTDTLIAFLWIGNASNHTEKFAKTLINHIEDNCLENNSGLERVVGYFTNDFAERNVSYFNVTFDDRQSHTDTRDLRGKPFVELPNLKRLTGNQLVWFKNYRNFIFFMADEDNYERPEPVMPEGQKADAQTYVKKITSQEECDRKVEDIKSTIGMWEYILELIENTRPHLPLTSPVKAKPRPKPKPSSKKPSPRKTRSGKVGKKSSPKKLEYGSEESETSSSSEEEDYDEDEGDSDDNMGRKGSRRITHKSKKRHLENPKKSHSPARNVRYKRLERFDEEGLKKHPAGSSLDATTSVESEEEVLYEKVTTGSRY